MTIKWYNAFSLQRPIKLRAHKTGNLGFTKEAARLMGLEDCKSIAIGKNSEDPKDESLYLLPEKEYNPCYFKIGQSDFYYHALTRTLFDSLGIDYRTGKVSFIMTQSVIDGITYYKLTRNTTEHADKRKVHVQNSK